MLAYNCPSNATKMAVRCHARGLATVPAMPDASEQSNYSHQSANDVTSSQTKVESFRWRCGRTLLWRCTQSRWSCWRRRSLLTIERRRHAIPRSLIFVVVIVSITTNSVQRRRGRLNLTRGSLIGVCGISSRRLINHAVKFLVHGVEDGHRLLDGVLSLVGVQHRRKSQCCRKCRLHSIGPRKVPGGDQLGILCTEVDQMTFQSLVWFALKTPVYPYNHINNDLRMWQ